MQVTRSMATNRVRPRWPSTVSDMLHEAWDAGTCCTGGSRHGKGEKTGVGEGALGRDTHNQGSHSRLHGGDARVQMDHCSQTDWKRWWTATVG